MAELLAGCEQKRQDEVRSLVSDPFLSELLPFLPRMSQLQMDGVLARVREIVGRPRRSA